MIGSFDLFKCKTKKCQDKIYLIKQANKIIDEKLDIVYYIRNMILYEKIYSIYLENKEIINFLSRPIIYLKDIGEKKPGNGINDFETNNASESTSAKEEIISGKQGDINLLPGEYRTEYRLNPIMLSENIERLISDQNKTENQKNLVKYLKNQLKCV